MQNETSDRTLIQSITRIVDHLVMDGSNYDLLISILSLLCLVSILTRSQPAMVSQGNPPQVATANPLQKVLGELSKGDGNGPSPDLLMTLLPLLNNPQLKAKMNPSNMAAIFSLLNNFSGASPEKNSGKQEKSEVNQEQPVLNPSTAFAGTDSVNSSSPTVNVDDQRENIARESGRSLNWKSNF